MPRRFCAGIPVVVLSPESVPSAADLLSRAPWSECEPAQGGRVPGGRRLRVWSFAAAGWMRRAQEITKPSRSPTAVRGSRSTRCGLSIGLPAVMG